MFLTRLQSEPSITKPLGTIEEVKAGTEFTGEDTIDEVKARIEESYFDLLQTHLKVKSKDDINVIYFPNMLENHLTVNHYGIHPYSTSYMRRKTTPARV